jgi:hypothetical protein
MQWTAACRLIPSAAPFKTYTSLPLTFDNFNTWCRFNKGRSTFHRRVDTFQSRARKEAVEREPMRPC